MTIMVGHNRARLGTFARFVSRETAFDELAHQPVRPRETQCGSKTPWLSKMLASNFAELVMLANPGGGVLEAYPCPWCSTTSYVLWHIGHPPAAR